MFDLFRSREKSVRVLLGVLLGLVALSMLVYLIPGGPGSGSAAGDSTVASVAGDKVTSQDVERAVQRLAQGQANIPKALIANYIPVIVNQLVDSKAMAYRAKEMGITVSDAELANLIQTEFKQQLGQEFSMNIYKMALSQQGMTVPQYEANRRENFLGQRLESIVLQSIVVTDDEAKKEYARKNLKVGLQYIAFTPADFSAKVSKDPAALKAYFEKNKNSFQIPEKRNVELITGNTNDFSQTAKVSDDELRKTYQENLDSYRTPERVQVRHILIKTQGKPKEEQPKLKAKAEDILKQLKGGADFAALAKKNSEDPGSGAKGGDLGWVVRGQTVPNFEKAAFSQKPQELSGLVETEFGYHIIQVTQKQTAHTQTFEEVRPQLLSEAQKDAGAVNLKKAAGDARAEIAKTPAQAEAIAKKYGLKFFTLTDVLQSGTLPEVGSQPEVTNAVFSTAKGSVSDVVNLDAQGKAALVLVTAIDKAHPAQFAEVEKDVEKRYTAAETQRLAEEAAKNAAAAAKKGGTLAAVAKQYGGTVKTAAPFSTDGAAEGIGPATLLADAFKPSAKVGDVLGPVNAQSSQFVCKISERTPADMSQFEKNRDSIVQGLESQKREVQQSLFRDSIVTELKQRGKVKVNEALVNRMVAAYAS